MYIQINLFDKLNLMNIDSSDFSARNLFCGNRVNYKL